MFVQILRTHPGLIPNPTTLRPTRTANRPQSVPKTPASVNFPVNFYGTLWMHQLWKLALIALRSGAFILALWLLSHIK